MDSLHTSDNNFALALVRFIENVLAQNAFLTRSHHKITESRLKVACMFA